MIVMLGFCMTVLEEILSIVYINHSNVLCAERTEHLGVAEDERGISFKHLDFGD